MPRTKLIYDIYERVPAGTPFTIPEGASSISIKAADIGDWSVTVQGKTVTYLASDVNFTPSFEPPAYNGGFHPEMEVLGIGTDLLICVIS